MRAAFAAGAVVGLLAPAVGFFLVQRGQSLTGDAVGHVAFAGVALGSVLGIAPLLAALVTTVLAAVGADVLRTRRRVAGDQALALLFYGGIALGVVILSADRGLDASLFAFLFGSILTVSWAEVALVAAVGLAAVAALALFYRALLALAIDDEAARVQGVPVARLEVGLTAVAAATVAIAMPVVGVLLIAALMVLPVMAASRVAGSAAATIGIAMAIGLASVFAGLVFAYEADVAPGGAIVLAALAAVGICAAAQRMKSPVQGY